MTGAPITLRTDGCRLAVAHDGLLATLGAASGEPWLALRPLAAIDAIDGVDETLAVQRPERISEDTVEIRRRSTRWTSAWTRLICRDGVIEIETGVEGHGRLATARLLAARSQLPDQAHGLLPSGCRAPDVFSPNPDDPRRVLRPLAQGARIGVVGDSEPGRGRWLFTPAPLYLCLGTIGVSVVAPVDRLRFCELALEGATEAFALALPYEGHEQVKGAFMAPSVVLTPGVTDPYAGLRGHRSLLSARGAAPRPARRFTPSWWSEPIFCGWGAQNVRGQEIGRPAAELATQTEYDGYLERLERRGLEPGTIVLDDKWQRSYGANEPDQAKWPDLRGWIARRHARRQRVLLWFKAWDPEGLDPALCVCNADGEPLAFDPTAPGAREHVRSMTRRLLGPEGLDADGLKIDFTARTPSGHGAASHSGAWGISLLYELLRIIYDTAKEADPEALVVTQTPHPAFVDVSDMIRLNDILDPSQAGASDEEVASSVAEQMRHRAAVTAAACPELLIDTDDWRQPNLVSWRRYQAVKPRLGVPALYYVDGLESGEDLQDEDYVALREAWATCRDARP